MRKKGSLLEDRFTSSIVELYSEHYFYWHVDGMILWLSIAFILYLGAQLSTMAYFIPAAKCLSFLPKIIPGQDYQH